MEMNQFRGLYPEIRMANFLWLFKLPPNWMVRWNLQNKRLQDTETADAPERKRSTHKKKTPARARRDRKRWTEWYQKKCKSATSAAPKPSNPAVTSQQLDQLRGFGNSISQTGLSNSTEVWRYYTFWNSQWVLNRLPNYLRKMTYQVRTLIVMMMRRIQVWLNGQTFVQIVFWHPREYTEEISSCQLSQDCSFSCQKEN